MRILFTETNSNTCSARRGLLIFVCTSPRLKYRVEIKYKEILWRCIGTHKSRDNHNEKIVNFILNIWWERDIKERKTKVRCYGDDVVSGILQSGIKKFTTIFVRTAVKAQVTRIFFPQIRRTTIIKKQNVQHTNKKSISLSSFCFCSNAPLTNNKYG